MRMYRIANDDGIPAGYVLLEVVHDEHATSKTKIAGYGEGNKCDSIGQYQGEGAGKKFVDEFETRVIGSGETVDGGLTNDYHKQKQEDLNHHKYLRQHH